MRVRVGSKNCLVITVCHLSASLQMPNGDPRDGFFYCWVMTNEVSHSWWILIYHYKTFARSHLLSWKFTRFSWKFTRFTVDTKIVLLLIFTLNIQSKGGSCHSSFWSIVVSVKMMKTVELSRQEIATQNSDGQTGVFKIGIIKWFIATLQYFLPLHQK